MIHLLPYLAAVSAIASIPVDGLPGFALALAAVICGGMYLTWARFR